MAVALLESARALAPQIRAAGAWMEREGKLEPSIVKALMKAGLFRMVVPRSLGGGEVDLLTMARVIEEVATADGSTAWCLSQGGVTGMNLAYLDEDTARELFRDPDTVMAHSHGPGASATPVEGGYRMTGRWTYGTGCHHSAWLSGDAFFYHPDGTPVRHPGGAMSGVTAFFPASEAQIVPSWNVSGLRGTGSDTFVATDLFVPARRTVTIPRGEPREQGTLYVLPPRWAYAAGFASVALGVARGMLDSYADLAAAKIPRASTRVLRENAVVQSQTGRAEARLRAARALLHETLRDAWEAAERTRTLTQEQRVLLRMATTHAMNEAVKVAGTVHRAAGATAIDADQPFDRPFRDIHAAKQHLHAHQMHYESIGQYFLGLEPDTNWM